MTESTHPEQEEIELLLKLFAGRRDAYGLGKGTVERNPKGDWNGMFWEHMAACHLDGEANADLGVYLVRDDDTVTFAAVDIDEPNFELALEVAGLAILEAAVFTKIADGLLEVSVLVAHGRHRRRATDHE